MVLGVLLLVQQNVMISADENNQPVPPRQLTEPIDNVSVVIHNLTLRSIIGNDVTSVYEHIPIGQHE